MTFLKLRDRLTASLRERVQRGELTERRLARLTGISQPHIHNVLNGKRMLSPETADKVIATLGIDLLDLVEPEEFLNWRKSH
jgi:plasmid maintenance system antidote protein VapI